MPLLLGVVLLAAIAAAGWYGWSQWQAWNARQQNQAQQQLGALEQRLDTLRRDQHAQGERIQDAAATNRVLRDEVLGLSQRGALLEDSVAKLVDSTHQGVAALRLDQAELELHLAAQRLTIAGDLPGARQAYALAADTLHGLDDPRLLNVKQALEQERAAVEQLGDGPQAKADAQLTEASAALAQLPRKATVEDTTRPSWQRILSPLIDVRPSGTRVAVAPAQRAAFENALQLELTLARAALERNDRPAFQGAMTRAAAWLPRLWPASPQASAVEKQFGQIAALPLQPDLPAQGSTLRLLQSVRSRPAAPTPLPAARAHDANPGTGDTP
ncbi:uroporphyrinogen-III C-methyltransferase [Pseudoxanthomonas sp.]|uniref:uroporphyrinogen-III C-methyltransferase n=1 Tax=Pseudoxanthomonas sp. TaxID=1871049 RepID=UPI0026353445|nr:uroporphyrinogen-III C-methyltransferase [Pseudoxanthomonas sp.]WDS34859.1 MAG: uroporphyrinogen-III C-methyltransferase [Pseudoxanthomonas sp.]